MKKLPAHGYGYVELEHDIAALMGYGPLVQSAVIGHSVMGKPLYALRCGQGAKRMHINASCHANEWITSAVVMHFLSELLEAGAQGKSYRGRDSAALLREVAIWSVPMVNPDGVDLALHGVSPEHPFCKVLLEWNGGRHSFSHWKANIRGIDLNDQYPAYWEAECARRTTDRPGPANYPGRAPLCEPEARSLARFTELLGFNLALSLHTQGKEIYWNYRGYEPEQSEALAQRLAAASGYRAVKLADSDAGYKDWFIKQFRRPGFTIELGEGTNPLPIAQFPAIFEEAAELLLEALDITRES